VFDVVRGRDGGELLTAVQKRQSGLADCRLHDGRLVCSQRERLQCSRPREVSKCKGASTPDDPARTVQHGAVRVLPV